MGTSATLPAVETTRPQRIAVKSFTTTLLSAATLLTTMDIASATDWPQWRGIKRNGISYETGWLTNWPPTEVWRRTDIGNIESFSSSTIHRDRLYTIGYTTAGANSNLVYCLDALTGTNIWIRTFGCGTGSGDGLYRGVKSAPVVVDDEVYTFSQDGHLHCFARNTGSTLWSTNIGTSKQPYWGFAGSPVVESNLVIVAVGEAGMAINRNPPHNVIWSLTTGDTGYSSPLVYTSTNGQRIVVFNSINAIQGLNATNGTLVWKCPWKGSTDLSGIPDPVLFDNKMFVSDSYASRGGCMLVQLGTGILTPAWSNTNLRTSTVTPVYQNGYAFGFNGGVGAIANRLRCIDMSNGSVKWTSTNTVNDGSLIYADGQLIVQNKNGDIFVVEATTNYVILRPPFNMGGADDSFTAPTLSNGRLYCRRNATLVCFRVGPVPESDGDTDGMPDAWEQRHFTGAANCGPTDDSDGDGVSNRDEYLAGTDPTNGQSCATMTATSTGGKLVFTTPTVKAEGTGYMTRARFYTMESSTSLTGSAWSPFLDCMDVVGTNAPISYTNTPSGSQKFYRMKVTLE